MQQLVMMLNVIHAIRIVGHVMEMVIHFIKLELQKLIKQLLKMIMVM